MKQGEERGAPFEGRRPTQLDEGVHRSVYSAHTSRAQTLRHVCMHFECRGVNTERNPISAPKDNREKGRRAVRAGARAEEAGRRGAPPSPARGAPTVGGANRGEKCPTFPENRERENPRVAPHGLCSICNLRNRGGAAHRGAASTGVSHRLGATTIHRKDGSSEACAATGRLAARPARAGAAVSLFHLRPTQLVFWGS